MYLTSIFYSFSREKKYQALHTCTTSMFAFPSVGSLGTRLTSMWVTSCTVSICTNASCGRLMTVFQWQISGALDLVLWTWQTGNLVPRTHLLLSKRSVVISWSCRISSLDFEQAYDCILMTLDDVALFDWHKNSRLLCVRAHWVNSHQVQF